MRPHGPPHYPLTRRLKAMELLQEGLSLNQAARQIGCSPSTVMRWRNRWRESGNQGLQAVKPHGRPRKMNEDQVEELQRLLARGPRAFGWKRDTWTARVICDVLWDELRIYYHPGHLSRLLRSWGLTPHRTKPEVRRPNAGQR